MFFHAFDLLLVKVRCKHNETPGDDDGGWIVTYFLEQSLPSTRGSVDPKWGSVLAGQWTDDASMALCSAPSEPKALRAHSCLLLPVQMIMPLKGLSGPLDLGGFWNYYTLFFPHATA